MLKTRILALLLIVALLTGVVGVMAQDQTIVDIASGNEDFSTLVDLVTTAGLVDTLIGEGPFTLFAPTNEAFAKLPAAVVDYLKSDTEMLARVLTYHVVAGKVMSADASTMMAASVEGSELNIIADDMGVHVDNAAVTQADIEASNGVIHAIDSVLIPPIELAEVDALSVTGSIASAGSSTVFPLAEAVAKAFTDAGYAEQITIDSIGSGAGYTRFCSSGESDIANASRGIKQSEIDNCAAIGRTPIEFRVGTDALAVVVNPSSAVSSLSVAQLALVFSDPRDDEGNVIAQRTWADIDPSWPAEPIQRFIPGTDSGTFDYFVEAVFLGIFEDQAESGEYADPFVASDFEKDTNDEYVVGVEGPILSSAHQASEDDNVLVQGVEGSANGIGFFGYAYYVNEGNKLSILSIAADGEPITATNATVDAGEYPLARPLFIYSDANIIAEKPQVGEFISFFLSNANEKTAEVGYFPPNPYQLRLAKLQLLAAQHAAMM